MNRRTFLVPFAALFAVFVLTLAQPGNAGASRAPLDPWQREFLQNSFGTLDAARLPSSEHRTTAQGLGVDAPSWTEYGPPVARAAAAGAYDLRNHRVILFGGSDGANRNDVWVLRLSDTTFVKVPVLGTPPTPRVGHTMVYDSLRKRVLVFGGWDGAYRNDLWQLSLLDSVWTELTATGPAGRAAHSAVYDPVGDRMIVYGGWDGTTRGDAWSLSLAGAPAWTEISAGGDVPVARYGHSAVWDDSLSRMVVFGGEWRGSDVDYYYMNDVHQLSFAGAPTWSAVAARAGNAGIPAERYAHSAILDPRNDKMIVFGGWSGVYEQDTWELSLLDNVWRQNNATTNRPAARANHVAVYDSLARRMLIVWGWGDGQPRNNQHAMTTLTGDWLLLAAMRGAPSPRFASSLVYDGPRDRMVLFGGSNVGAHLADVWWFPLGGTNWSLQTTGGTTPAGRSDHAAVFDSVNNQMIVMGGRSHTYGQVELIRFDDTWALPLVGLPNWTPVVPQTAPRGRTGESVVLDAARRRLIVFGGQVGAAYRNDVWILDLADSVWTRITALDTLPAARTEHAAVYDAPRDRLVLFGGRNASGALDDVWELSFAGTPRWTRLTPAGTAPTARYGHSMTLDPSGSRALVFGGLTGAGLMVNETWELGLAAPQWTLLTPAGTPPPARAHHSAIAGPQGLVVFGGLAQVNGTTGNTNDLWTLSFASPTWGQILAHAPLDSITPRPNARSKHVAVYDPAANRMLLFGGTDADTVFDARRQSIVNGAVWSLRLDDFAWSVVDSSGQGPTAMNDQRGVFDIAGRRLLLLGIPTGHEIRTTINAFTVGLVNDWSTLVFPGSTPSGRFGHGMVYDPIRRRIVVFGGDTAEGRTNEVWTLELADPAWSLLEVTGTPPSARDQHRVAYDHTRNRMIVFGGYDGTQALNDLWSLSLDAVPAWSALTPVGTPPSARYGHTMVYDRPRDRLLVMGGWDGAIRDDVWELALASAAWTQIQPTGSPIVAREEHSSVFDPTRNRLVIWGGYAISRISSPRNDLWSLRWPTTAPGISATAIGVDAAPGALHVTWRLSESGAARVYRAVDGSPWQAVATVRDAGDAMLTFADADLPVGTRFGYRLGLLREGGEDFAGEIWTDAPAARPGSLPIVFPSPARGEFSVSFTLPDARAARLELFDLAGRRVYERRLESLGVGTHRLAIGGKLPAGIYLVQLTHGDVSRTVRAVVLE